MKVPYLRLRLRYFSAFNIAQLCVSYMLNVVVKIYPFLNNHGVAGRPFRTLYYELILVRRLHPLKMSSDLEERCRHT